LRAGLCSHAAPFKLCAGRCFSPTASFSPTSPLAGSSPLIQTAYVPFLLWGFFFRDPWIHHPPVFFGTFTLLAIMTTPSLQSIFVPLLGSLPFLFMVIVYDSPRPWKFSSFLVSFVFVSSGSFFRLLLVNQLLFAASFFMSLFHGGVFRFFTVCACARTRLLSPPPPKGDGPRFQGHLFSNGARDGQRRQQSIFLLPVFFDFDFPCCRLPLCPPRDFAFQCFSFFNLQVWAVLGFDHTVLVFNWRQPPSVFLRPPSSS